MTSAAQVDVNSLRDEYESNTEWNLRRKFIQANKDSLPLTRLICLSRCFVNMTVYNCSYPPAVMETVHHRSQSCQQEIEKQGLEKSALLRKRAQIMFVKSSESLGSETDSNPKSTNQNLVESCQIVENQSKQNSFSQSLHSVQSTHNTNQCDSNTPSSGFSGNRPVPPKHYPPSDNNFHSRPNQNPQQRKNPSQGQFAGRKRQYNQPKTLGDFVVVEPFEFLIVSSAIETIHRSADFSHMRPDYEFLPHQSGWRCILRIENTVVADVISEIKQDAKTNACAQALSHLKQNCWTIKIKQAVDSSGAGVSKDNLTDGLSELSELIGNGSVNTDDNRIGTDNVGNKMLCKMGWTGGGMGKDGAGITEPVSLKTVYNREGLGLDASKNITVQFRQKIRELIKSYASSANQDDLVFNSEFSSEERAVIHMESRKLHLVSKSRGKGDNRYLCISRKRSPNKLIDYLLSVGGETSKYFLVQPGCDAGNTGN